MGFGVFEGENSCPGSIPRWIDNCPDLKSEQIISCPNCKFR